MAISREEAIKEFELLLKEYPKNTSMPTFLNLDSEEAEEYINNNRIFRGMLLKAISDLEKLQKIEDLIDTHTMSRYFTEEDLHKDVYEKIVQIVNEVE